VRTPGEPQSDRENGDYAAADHQAIPRASGSWRVFLVSHRTSLHPDRRQEPNRYERLRMGRALESLSSRSGGRSTIAEGSSAAATFAERWMGMRTWLDR